MLRIKLACHLCTLPVWGRLCAVHVYSAGLWVSVEHGACLHGRSLRKGTVRTRVQWHLPLLCSTSCPCCCIPKRSSEHAQRPTLLLFTWQTHRHCAHDVLLRVGCGSKGLVQHPMVLYRLCDRSPTWSLEALRCWPRRLLACCKVSRQLLPLPPNFGLRCEEAG